MESCVVTVVGGSKVCYEGERIVRVDGRRG